MKALVLSEYNRFDYQDRPEPEVGPDEVLVRVKACGICGSDVHGMDGSTGRRQPPIVMGHEAAGVIAQVGGNVTEWEKGERVTFDSTVYCGKCWFCRRGEISLCDNRRVLGVSCDDYRLDGALAEYVAVPQHILYRLPGDLGFERATLVETLSIALHAVARVCVSPDDTALVMGAGMVGLLVVQGLRLAGCGKIIAVDLEQDRLDLACRLGADAGLKADSVDVPAEVLKLTGGRGADVAVEAVGITPSVNSALASLRKGGVLTLVGNLSPTIELPLQAVVAGEITVCGSYASQGEYPAAIEAITSGRVNVEALISATAPLSEGAAWFKRLHDREPGLLKVVLEP
ncbi:MAG: galactitol-1-phosphate 5-dehydrogenase [Fidelibacterota bacterium]|nr:MAG: galactitol-1-phosphate 5-dehydrogenase [Candidatus Neomarinimicrobiota bacterium]